MSKTMDRDYKQHRAEQILNDGNQAKWENGELGEDEKYVRLSAKDARIQDLEGTLGLVTAQSNKAMRERDTLKTKLDEQARDTLVVLDERDELREEMSAANGDSEHYREQAVSLLKERDELRKQNDVNVQYAKAEIEHIRAQLADAKIQEREHHLMLHELRMELDETNEKLTAHKTHCRILTSQWDEANDKLADAESILECYREDAKERAAPTTQWEVKAPERMYEDAPTINGNQHTPNSDFTAGDLRARVKELQAPTIVDSLKIQTISGSLNIYVHSDGSVKATLEALEGGE